jgi:hypothetical protein
MSLLLLRWHYSPKRTFAYLKSLSQSTLFFDLPFQLLILHSYLINPSPLPTSIPLYLTVPRPHFSFPNGQLFTVTGFQPVTQNPTWRASLPNLYPPGQGGPAVPPGTGSPFTTCMGCSGTILFPCHHTGKVLLLVWYLPFDLSGLGCPTSSYATAGIAVWVIGKYNPHHHDQVEAPSVGISTHCDSLFMTFSPVKTYHKFSEELRKKNLPTGSDPGKLYTN